jgi:hypothetical protein
VSIDHCGWKGRDFGVAVRRISRDRSFIVIIIIIIIII